MPAIRDFSYNYTTAQNATTITCDVPDYRENDLLVAVLSADTGTPNWSSTGWTQYFTQTNAANIAIVYKIASAAEPETYTFTASSPETFNAAIISIEDIDTATPFANFAQVNRTTATLAFPTTTATRNNSLILYLSSHASTAVIASGIEGAVTQLFAKDGNAHQDHVSWGFQRSSGTTRSDIRSSVSGTTFNGKLVTVVVNPPSTGATIIPTYCDDDLSIYVDPIHGTTAFRGNTAFANTATTSFGTTIAGRTLANATVSAQADKGVVNTYRSVGGTTSSTNRTWQGARLALAAGNILTTAAGKNILCHVLPNSPIDIQTLETYSIERGVAFGMYSTNNNFKIFHVHGADTSFGYNRTPIVINSSATTTLQQTGTLNQNSIAGFGCFVSGFVTSADMIWGMIWVLDTTVVCGGQSDRPVTLAKIVRTLAQGHERISALQQGTNQILVFQPFQIGNGTDSTYLDASSGSFEFPRQYDLASGQVNYHSIDNVAGVTFYPSANDTFDLRNSVFSSPSKFHWRWNASSSGSATVLTEKMSVVNSGDAILAQNIIYDQITFTNCNSITQNNATISGCTLLDSTINSTNLNAITGSSFESSGTGHAIVFTGSLATPVIATLTNIDFSGYASTNGSTGNEAIYVNVASGSLTLQIAGGNIPSIRTAGATVTVDVSATITLTGLQPDSEVRAYLGTDPATATELAGIESTVTVDPDDSEKTIFSFAQSAGGQAGYIQIFHVSYQPIILSITYPTENREIPVQQIFDRQYARGTVFNPG